MQFIGATAETSIDEFVAASKYFQSPIKLTVIRRHTKV